MYYTHFSINYEDKAVEKRDDIVDKFLNIDHVTFAHTKGGRKPHADNVGGLLFLGAVDHTDDCSNFRATNVQARKDTFLGHSEGRANE